MALREVLAKFGFDVDSSKLTAAVGGVDSLVGSIGKLQGIVGAGLGALGLGALKSQADELAQESKDLGLAAQKSGLGFEEFQRLSYTSGLSSEKLVGVFRKLGQTVAAAGGKAEEAAGGLDELGGGLEKVLSKKAAGDIFKSLGLTATEDIGENFDNIIGKLAAMPDKVNRNALALKIFGRNGQDLIPFLEKSPEELARLSEEFSTFGGITEADRKKLKAYTNETKTMNLALRSVKITVVTTLVPALTAIVGALVSGVTWIKKTVDTSELLTTTLIILGAGFLLLKGQAAAAALATAVNWALAAAPLIALGLVIDDLIHFVKGDAKTATGALFDAFFEKGAGDSIAAQMRKDLADLTADMNKAQGIGGKLEAVFSDVGAGLVKFFVETIPELTTVLNEKFKEVGMSVGRSLSIAIVQALIASLGETISGGLGLSDKLASLRKEEAGASTAAQQRKENLAVPTTTQRQATLGFADGAAYGPVNPYVNPQGAKIVESKAGPTNQAVSQTNAVTVNVYGSDSPENTIRGTMDTLNKGAAALAATLVKQKVPG